LVFTRYKPNTHDLETLYGYVNSQQPEFLKVFPQSTPEEKRRFELLRKAYVDARYKPKATASLLKNLLGWLSALSCLREMTQTLCEAKIESFIE
jgi:hypothetical protein